MLWSRAARAKTSIPALCVSGNEARIRQITFGLSKFRMGAISTPGSDIRC